MKLFTYCSILWLLLNLSVERGECNHLSTTALIQNQLRLLEKVTEMLASKRQVVFHAEVGSSYQTFQKDNIWIYKKVITNVGNAYNPSTGKFTVPTNGIYQFHWYTLSDPKKMSHAGLFVNGRIKARQASNNSGGSNQWITAGSSIALPLKKGDEVYIRNVHVSLPTHLMGPWTAFGGVLIN